MKQSVIISTYNQPKWLEKALEGYRYQSFRDFELVIADDGSGEETRAVIDQFREAVDFPVQHIWHEDRGFQKCIILNKACLAAQGDYLVFTDGDCIPRADFLEVHDSYSAPMRFLSGGYCKLSMPLSEAISLTDIQNGNAFDVSWLKQRGDIGFSQMLKIGAGSLAPLFDLITPTKATWNGHSASTWKEHVMAVNGHNELMRYGGEDRELGERLLNFGLKPKGIRYRAILLHLDHARSYVNQEDLERNLKIREEVKNSGAKWCENGIIKSQRRDEM